MSSIATFAAELQTLLGPVADDAARTSGCVRRVRKLTGAVLVQALVLGWLVNPLASLAELTRRIAQRGVHLTPQALEQRFTPALAACLETLLAQAAGLVVTSDPAAIPLLGRFRGGIYLVDTTTVSLPDALAAVWRGSGGGAGQGQSALKLAVRLELTGGQLAGPDCLAGRTNDRRSRVAEAALPPDSLQVADLGFFRVARLGQIVADGGAVLTRWQANTALADLDGPPWEDVAGVLERRADGDGVVDCAVLVGASERLPLRLIAVRAPAAVAARRRQAKRRRAQRNGYTARASSLAVCDWTIVLTSVPAERLSPAEALVLLRARWQVELLFKDWKGPGGLEDWRSAQPWRILAEVYAKALGCLLVHWVLVVGGWVAPGRSLVMARQVVRDYAVLMLDCLDAIPGLRGLLRHIVTQIQTTCRLTTRRTAPNAVDLWLDPTRQPLS